MTDYAEMVYLKDKEGNEYACPINALKGKIKKQADLTDEEKKKCVDMSEMVDQFWG